MKASLITAALLLGSTEAAVHKMKLNKVPLDEQLVSLAFGSLPAHLPSSGHGANVSFRA